MHSNIFSYGCRSYSLKFNYFWETSFSFLNSAYVSRHLKFNLDSKNTDVSIYLFGGYFDIWKCLIKYMHNNIYYHPTLFRQDSFKTHLHHIDTWKNNITLNYASNKNRKRLCTWNDFIVIVQPLCVYSREMIAYATRIQIRLNKDFSKVCKFFISLCLVPHVCQKAFSYLYRTFLLEVFTKPHQKLNSRWYTCTHSLG